MVRLACFPVDEIVQQVEILKTKIDEDRPLNAYIENIYVKGILHR